MKKIVFEYKDSMNLVYKSDGHYHIKVPSFYETNSYANDEVDFVLDTGAYITVISRGAAMLLGWDKIKPSKEKLELNGFAGSACTGEIKSIPGMVLGGRRLIGVKVAIPYKDTKDNILGLNVLEYFQYLIDSTENKIYFADNYNYKVRPELRCGKVSLLTDDKELAVCVLSKDDILALKCCSLGEGVVQGSDGSFEVYPSLPLSYNIFQSLVNRGYLVNFDNVFKLTDLGRSALL